MGYSVFAGAGQWRAAADEANASGLFGYDEASGGWTPLTRGLPAGVEVRALAIRPDRPETVWAGTQSGPCRSDDGGESWTALPLPEGTSAEESVVWSICLDPSDPETVYVGTQGTAVFRGRNGGPWERLPVAPPPGMVRMSFPCRVVRIAVNPADGREIHAAFEVGGAARSLDGGATWESGNASLLALAEQDRLKSRIVSDTETEGMMDSHALAAAAGSGTLWLANRMGLFRSADRGASWSEFGIGRFSPLTYARDVKVSAHDPRRLYAALSVAADSDAGALWRSDDAGETWTRFDRGVSIDSTLMIVAEGARSGERVWCAARRGQVFGTADGGATWTETRLPGGVEGVYALAAA